MRICASFGKGKRCCGSERRASLPIGKFTDAQKDLKQILALPAGGVHRDDAQKYLTKPYLSSRRRTRY